MQSRSLSGRHVAVLAADGFEKVELTVPVAALRGAGAVVDIVSLRRGRIRGVNLHEPASRVRVDKILAQARAVDYDALFIPGGFINPDLLRQSSAAREFVREFATSNKPIGTLCHGPWVLASANVVSERTLTSWPGVRDDLVNAGATWLDQSVVNDGNLITSRGPQDLAQFVPALVRHFASAGSVRSVAQKGRTSSPQRNEPPAAVLAAMKWLPRPSLRTAIGLGMLLGGALWATRASGRRAPTKSIATPQRGDGVDLSEASLSEASLSEASRSMGGLCAPTAV
jgi:protease I